MKAFPYPVIIDTDIGDDIDDTWAIMLTLCCGLFDVRAISLVNYDTEYKATLLAKMLGRIGREDIPIFVSPATPLPDFYREGQGGWLADYRLSEYKGRIFREDYIEGLYRTVCECGERVCIFELGPSTTLAALYRAHPDIIEKSFVYAMAGSVRKGYGGSEGGTGEFNIGIDAAAARTVLESGWDYTMLPLDVCATLRMSGETYRKFLAKESVGANIVRENYRHWIRDEMFGNRNDFESASSILYDIVVPWFALFPESFTVERTPLWLDQGNILREGKGSPVKWASGITRVEEMMRWSEEVL